MLTRNRNQQLNSAQPPSYPIQKATPHTLKKTKAYNKLFPNVHIRPTCINLVLSSYIDHQHQSKNEVQTKMNYQEIMTQSFMIHELQYSIKN